MTERTIQDPRPVIRALWETHQGMHAGIHPDGLTPPTCFCGAPLDVVNGAPWPEVVEAFHRHLWAVLGAVVATAETGQDWLTSDECEGLANYVAAHRQKHESTGIACTDECGRQAVLRGFEEAVLASRAARSIPTGAER